MASFQVMWLFLGFAWLLVTACAASWGNSNEATVGKGSRLGRRIVMTALSYERKMELS